VAGGKTSKSEDTSKTATTIQADKVTDSAKISEVEAKVDEAKSKEVKGSEGRHHGNEALSTVTGAFDVFKLGGKKSK
jgi:cell wall assembly regulator SMI1